KGLHTPSVQKVINFYTLEEAFAKSSGAILYNNIIFIQGTITYFIGEKVVMEVVLKTKQKKIHSRGLFE
ncbi:MAG: hypothetical protein AB1298_07860, partial [Bacteroidota bacterium]